LMLLLMLMLMLLLRVLLLLLLLVLVLLRVLRLLLWVLLLLLLVLGMLAVRIHAGARVVAVRGVMWFLLVIPVGVWVGRLLCRMLVVLMVRGVD
jgi:hypothetical protein